MLKKLSFIIGCLLFFAVYHVNTERGPDNDVYLSVARQIVTAGHLNVLASQLPADVLSQISQSRHAPIHQNVGGVLFFLPAEALAMLSTSLASRIPNLPERFFDLAYHEALWIGSTATVLALMTCLLMFRVGRRYATPRAAIAALLACGYGGPLLIYTAVFPCQMHLPAAFLAALLLYCYHFTDAGKKRTWLLLGAIWGLGVLVRAEFVVWGVLILYGAFAAPPVEDGDRWRLAALRCGLAGCGGLLFLIPSQMIRQVVFGVPGNTYGVQFDLAILARAYLMLVGGRNGLFTFWPVLAIALLGYGLQARRNQTLYHVLAVIVVLAALICGSTVFWSGEFGASFGQRRFLLVLPCFVLFLARLFDLNSRAFWWLVVLCAAAVCWALAAYSVYGEVWRLADGRVGFLMPHDLTLMISPLAACAAQLPVRIFTLLCMPKHLDMVWLLPLTAAGGGILYAAGGLLRRHAAEYGLACLVVVACAATVFLAGARQRGEAAFAAIAAVNPQAKFIVRNYEVDGEIMGSMVDVVSFFMEIGQGQTAQYFVDKGERFFAAEAPDQVEAFTQMVDALRLRQAMGWYRLVPEQSHSAMLNWYRVAQINQAAGQAPPDISGQFLY